MQTQISTTGLRPRHRQHDVGDLNGDGIPDLVAAGRREPRLAVAFTAQPFIGTAAKGTFCPAILLSPGGQTFAAGGFLAPVMGSSILPHPPACCRATAMELSSRPSSGLTIRPARWSITLPPILTAMGKLDLAVATLTRFRTRPITIGLDILAGQR